MIFRRDIEEVDTRIRAGWHVDFDDCYDHASGQRKRYLRAENERLASRVPPLHETLLLAGVGGGAEDLKDVKATGVRVDACFPFMDAVDEERELSS